MSKKSKEQLLQLDKRLYQEISEIEASNWNRLVQAVVE